MIFTMIYSVYIKEIPKNGDFNIIIWALFCLLFLGLFHLIFMYVSKKALNKKQKKRKKNRK